MRIVTFAAVAVASFAVASCSKPTGTVDSASDRLGAAQVTSVSFQGAGKIYNFGQPPAPGQPWPEFDLLSYEALMGYAPPAVQIKYTRKATILPNRGPQPDPVEQRTEVYLAEGAAWFVPGQPVAVNQNWPASVEERTAEIIATPHGFLRAAKANNATVAPLEGGGSDVTFTEGRLNFSGRINARDEVERVQTTLDMPGTGDTPVEFVFSDYKDFGGFVFPGRIQRNQGGFPTLDLTVAAASKNPKVAITVPDSAKAPPAPPAIAVEQLAKGVWFLKSSHNSIVIEQADHIVVVEGPVSERHAEAVIARTKDLIPGKPIKYVINSHVHFDHSGGLRTFVAEGATVVTHEVNKPYYEKIWANPHTLNPDRLSTTGKTATFETVGDKHVITDGMRPIEMHLMPNSGHADGFLMVYLPNEKIISQADAYSPRPADAGPPTTVSPYAKEFHDHIERLKLDVAVIAPLHGRAGTMADLKRDIGLIDPKAK